MLQNKPGKINDIKETKRTYNIKDSKTEQQIVEDSMNFLSWELPDWNAIADDADDADDGDEDAFSQPLEVVDRNLEAILKLFRKLLPLD